MSIKSLLQNRGDIIVKRIQIELDAKNINASGRLSASGLAEVTETRGSTRLQVSFFDYILDVDEGRSPKEQREKTFAELFEDYLQWINDKKLGLIGTFATSEQMAGVFVAKTRREGTVTFRTGESLGILSDVINEKTISELEKDILREIIEGFVDTVTKISKESGRIPHLYTFGPF